MGLSQNYGGGGLQTQLKQLSQIMGGGGGGGGGGLQTQLKQLSQIMGGGGGGLEASEPPIPTPMYCIENSINSTFSSLLCEKQGILSEFS